LKIKTKSKLEFSGNEVSIYENYEAGNTDWMPNGTTVFLQGLKAVKLTIMLG